MYHTPLHFQTFGGPTCFCCSRSSRRAFRSMASCLAFISPLAPASNEPQLQALDFKRLLDMAPAKDKKQNYIPTSWENTPLEPPTIQQK